MAEFGDTLQAQVFDWLEREYGLTSQSTSPLDFDPIRGRIDFIFRDVLNRKIGVVGEDFRGGALSGLGEFLWQRSESANFEIHEGTLDGVIVVVVVSDKTEANEARGLFPGDICNRVPPYLANDLVLGFVASNTFVPHFQQRSIFASSYPYWIRRLRLPDWVRRLVWRPADRTRE